MDVKGAQALRQRLDEVAAGRQLAGQLAKIGRRASRSTTRKKTAPDDERAA